MCSKGDWTHRRLSRTGIDESPHLGDVRIPLEGRRLQSRQRPLHREKRKPRRGGEVMERRRADPWSPSTH